MPIYSFQCDKCRRELDVIRTMAESDSPPSMEESPKGDDCPHDRWTKIIKYAPEKRYGDNWGYRKGKGYNNW